MLQEPRGASRLAEDTSENRLYSIYLILRTIVSLHSQCNLTTYTELLCQPKLRANTATLVPVVQQAFDTELVQQVAILGEFTALEVLDQTNG